MKKKIILILCLVFCFALVACNKQSNNEQKKGLTEKQIRAILEKESTSSKYSVASITFATDKAKINDLDVSVSGETITLGENTNSIQGYNNKQIIGYYDESGTTYYFYRLATNFEGKKSIWEFAASKEDDFNEIGWIQSFVENADDLVLVKFNKISDNDANYKQYKVYAIVGKNLKLVK